MEDTVFEKIIRGELPAYKICENTFSLAFLDIYPKEKGHVLLVPKTHYVWMQDVPDELIEKLFVQAKTLMRSMKQALLCDFVEVSVVGKDVPHFHIHLIPRMLEHGEQKEAILYAPGEIEEYQKALIHFLS